MINAVTTLLALAVEKISDAFKTKQAQVQQGDTARVSIAVAQIAGWANEYLLLIITYPFISGFVPKLAPYTHEGFAQIALMPDWYVYLFSAVTASVFGYTGWQRWLKK
jgi:hypothetical protein